MNDKVINSLESTKNHIKTINPNYVYCCLSGGNDSKAFTHLIMSNGLADGVLFIDTGISIPYVRDHVIEWCDHYGYPLEIEKTPVSYEDMVLGRVDGYSGGFPGNAMHYIMQNRLKGRAFEAFKRRKKQEAKDRGEKPWRYKFLLLSGVRKDESDIRSKYKPASKDVRFYWFNPIFYWSKTDCLRYLKANDIKTNPVSDILGFSGECLCGAHAHKGELAMIKQFYPKVGEYLENLQEKVKAAGFGWGWESKPPKGWRKGQSIMPFFWDNDAPICNNCSKKHSSV